MLGKLAAILAIAAVGIAYFWASQVEYGEIVTTGSGSVQGIVNTARDGRKYLSWRGIPYAQPPVGELRFADPLPTKPWDGVRDGSSFGPICSQVHPLTGFVAGTEDCLHLVINTPKLGTRGLKSQQPLPVIVYIHSGAYIFGDIGMTGPDYFMDEDVVFVFIKYRLGALGFLYTGDGVVRGNMGLKDQTEALRWIKKNIAYFGGDPNQVTIMGTSAGAASVHMHTLSKQSKGLFHRAISQSGAASNQWGFIQPKQSMENLQLFADKLNCSRSTNEELVKCLRGLEATDLVWATEELFNHKLMLKTPYLDGHGFVPTIEAIDDSQAFITDHPLKIVAKGQAHGVPHMMGHTTEEGAIATAHLHQDPKTIEMFEQNLSTRTRQLFQLSEDTPDSTVETILDIYVPKSIRNQLSQQERLLNYTKLFTDAFFVFDIRETVKLQRKFSPVYYYMHTKEHGPNLFTIFYDAPKDWPHALAMLYSGSKYLLKQALNLPQTYHGVDHAVDALYLDFPQPVLYLGKSSEFYQLSRDHVKVIVDFATNKQPLMVRGTEFKRLEKTGPLKVLEFNDATRLVPGPLEERLLKLHSLDIRGVNKISK